jgi:hypothetical protein
MTQTALSHIQVGVSQQKSSVEIAGMNLLVLTGRVFGEQMVHQSKVDSALVH